MNELWIFWQTDKVKIDFNGCNSSITNQLSLTLRGMEQVHVLVAKDASRHQISIYLSKQKR